MKQSDSNDVNYLEQLNLLQVPYGSNIDGAFFYSDPERNKYLDMLQHSLQNSDDVLLLIGESGSGKSSMLARIVDQTKEQWLIYRFTCTESTSADEFFSQIVDGFDLQSGSDAEEMLDALYARLDELQQRFPILIVDDAHNLSDDALEMVFHLAALDGNNGKLLRLVMAGNKELVERLNHVRFKSLPEPHVLQLEGMGEAHTAAYLMQRLQAAGHNGDSPFSVAELKQLHKDSDGIPGRLNVAANYLLSRKYGKRFLGSGLRRTVYAGIVATALLGIVVGLSDRLGMLFGDKQQEGGIPVAVEQSEKAVKSAEFTLIEAKQLQKKAVLETQTTKAVLVVKNGAVEVQQPILVAKSEFPQSAVKNTTSPEQKSTELKLLGTEPEKVVGSSKRMRLILRGKGFRPGTKVALSRGGKVEILQQDLVEFIDSGRLAFSVTPGLKKSDWAVQVSTPDNHRSNVLHFKIVPPSKEKKENLAQSGNAESAVSSAAVVEQKAKPAAKLPMKKIEPVARPSSKPAGKPQIKSKVTTTARGKDWYSTQPKENYTLQLLASASRTNINAFRKQYQLPEPLAQFSMKKGGLILHVLTYGSFPDRQAAIKAAASLPGGIKPWARSIANVRKVMLTEAEKNRAASVSTDSSLDAAWIWSQDPTHYTIQLAAGRSEKAVLMTKRQVTLPGELAVAKAMRNGKPWYVLVYGSFSSKVSASDTIGRLPAALKQRGPWARTFASLQEELSGSTPQ